MFGQYVEFGRDRGPHFNYRQFELGNPRDLISSSLAIWRCCRRRRPDSRYDLVPGILLMFSAAVRAMTSLPAAAGA